MKYNIIFIITISYYYSIIISINKIILVLQVEVKVLQGRLRRGRGIAIPLIQGVFDVKRIAKIGGTLTETLFAGEIGTITFSDR